MTGFDFYDEGISIDRNGRMNNSDNNTIINLYYPNISYKPQKKNIGRGKSLQQRVERHTYHNVLKRQPKGVYGFPIVQSEFNIAKHVFEGRRGSSEYKKLLITLGMIEKIPLQHVIGHATKTPIETLIENSGTEKEVAQLGAAMLKSGGVDAIVAEYAEGLFLGVPKTLRTRFKAGAKSVRINEKKYMLFKLPQFKTGNFLSSDTGSAFDANIMKWYFDGNGLETLAVSPAGKPVNVHSPTFEFAYSLTSSETRDRYIVRHVRDMGAFRTGMKERIINFLFGKEKRENYDNIFSFSYKIPVSRYIATGKIRRTETSELLKSGRYNELLASGDSVISSLNKKLFSNFFPDTPSYKISSLSRAQVILDFVHKIPYVKDPNFDYPKHPLETLAEYCGDCEDLSLLCASMMKNVGLDVKIAHFDNHTAVAVELGGNIDSNSYIGHRGKRYYLCETTGTGWPEKPAPHKVGQFHAEYTLRPERLRGLRSVESNVVEMDCYMGV